jgi:hypothetical protein
VKRRSKLDLSAAAAAGPEKRQAAGFEQLDTTGPAAGESATFSQKKEPGDTLRLPRRPAEWLSDPATRKLITKTVIVAAGAAIAVFLLKRR